MHPLHLSPLPSPRNEDEFLALQIERGGFVDEDVITALVTGPQSTRSTPYPDDLILSVDDMDFAGWQLSPVGHSRGAEVPPQVINAIIRRATPPVIDEPGIGTPHTGNHRWWLAGLAGVLSTLLFSLLLLTLAQRLGGDSKALMAPQSLSRSKITQPPTSQPSGSVSELTASSLERH